MLLGDWFAYRIEAAPPEVEARLRESENDIDRFRVHDASFSLAPSGIWWWLSWRRGLSLHGRFTARDLGTEVRVWFPFDVYSRLALLLLVLLAAFTDAGRGLGWAELVFVLLILGINVVVVSAAKRALLGTLESALETPTTPSWRYRLEPPPRAE